MKIAKVTDFKQKRIIEEKEMHLSYNHLFDNMIDAVCIIDETAKIQYINNAYERTFNIDGREIKGQTIFQTANDEVLLTALKKKNSLRGKLNYYIRGNQIYATATPIWYENTFKGIIVLYRQEPPYWQEKYNKVIELAQTTQEDNIKLNECFSTILGNSQNLRKALYAAQRASNVVSTVLLRGESGTGKELVAKAIHYSSDRKKQPFIKVNCGAIPSNLLESELFGHEKGAFTGAFKKRIGKFEEANLGTLFLDEIGDMPIEMQVKLLRVIQEKEFERVGGNKTITCDIRIIAATHKDLEELIVTGEFREDLYYRVNVIPISIPPLKERRVDIPLLCNHFIKEMNNRIGNNIKGVTEEVKKAFNEYAWPGNIRELENLIERLVVMIEKELIELDDLPPYISQSYSVNLSNSICSPLINLDAEGNMATLEEYEKQIIKQAIKRFKSFNATGKALGVTHKTIASKARKYNITD